MTITVSDGESTASIVIMVRVAILNNNPPQLNLAGQTMAIFVEGSMPLPIGEKYLNSRRKKILIFFIAKRLANDS